MPNRVEESLRRRLPRPLFSALRAIYNQRPGVVRARRQYARSAAQGRRVAEHYDWTVQAGPFRGLRYVDAYGDLGAKIVGSYEQELAPVIETIVRRGYDVIVNVGAAEGYYAVGLASRLPDATSVAYEMGDRGQALCRELAARNGVTVDVRGEFTADAFAALPAGDRLIVMDIEGGELPLLDPAAAPDLAQTDVLVELHDFVDTTIKPTILARFAATHDAQIIATADRNPADYSDLRALEVDVDLILDEHRPCPMEWAYLTRKK